MKRTTRERINPRLCSATVQERHHPPSLPDGCRAITFVRIDLLVIEHREMLLRAWNEFFHETD